MILRLAEFAVLATWWWYRCGARSADEHQFAELARRTATELKVVAWTAGTKRNQTDVFVNGKPYRVYGYECRLSETRRGQKVREKTADRVAEDRRRGRLVYALYVRANCEFAERTRDRLLRLVEPFPPSYLSGPRPPPGRRDEPFESCCERFAAVADRREERYANALFSFQHAFWSRGDTSADPAVLTALLSYAFQADSLGRLCAAAAADDDDALKTTVVRGLLGTLNALRRFAYLNCELPAERRRDGDDGPRLRYGFTWNGRTAAADPEAFLEDVAPLRLDEPRDRCGARRMLLADTFSATYAHVRWTTSDGARVAFGDATRRTLDAAGDASTVLRYQRFAFDTIVKLLLAKAARRLRDGGRLSAADAAGLRAVHDALRSGLRETFPVRLNDAFASVFSATAGGAEGPTMTAYLRSLSAVDLGRDEAGGCGAPFGDRLLPVSGLGDVVAYLLSIADDLKCFLRLFDFLRVRRDCAAGRGSEETAVAADFERKLPDRPNGKRDRLYWLETMDREDPAATRDREDDELGCELFGGLYHYLFSAAVCLNLAPDDGRYYGRARYLAYAVADALAGLRDGYLRRPHFETAWSALSLLNVARLPRLFADGHREDAKRVLHAVMAEFDGYGVERCGGFFFSRGLRRATVGRLSDVWERIARSSEALRAEDRDGHGRVKYALPADAMQTFERVKTRLLDDLGGFAAIVKSRWKGGTWRMDAVYLSLASPTAVAGYDLHSFPEHAYRFCFGALYVVLRRMVFHRPWTLEVTLRQTLFSELFAANRFPEKFRRVAHLLVAYVDCDHFAAADGDSASERARNVKNDEAVRREFERIGVQFDRLAETDRFDRDEDLSKTKSAFEMVYREFEDLYKT